MKKFTKALALLMALAMVFALAACSGGGDTGESSNNNASEAPKSTFAPVAKGQIKVGVIHIGNPKDTSGYTHAHDQGIVDMQKTLGLQDNQIIRKNNIDDQDKKAIETAIRECIEEGCNIIFGTSYGYMDTMEQLAAEYPEVIFSHCSGYKNNGKNLNNYFGRIYEARYLTGIAAGLKTKSNKIGYVAAQGSSNPEVTGGIDAFALGVKSVNKDAKVYVKVTNTWFDLNKEKSAAIALLDLGCDVIAQHQDTAQHHHRNHPAVAQEQPPFLLCRDGTRPFPQMDPFAVPPQDHTPGYRNRHKAGHRRHLDADQLFRRHEGRPRRYFPAVRQLCGWNKRSD